MSAAIAPERIIRDRRTPEVATVTPDAIGVHLQISQPEYDHLDGIIIPHELAAGIGRALMEFGS